MLKLLIMADQVANESGTADAMSISSISGETRYLRRSGFKAGSWQPIAHCIANTPARRDRKV